MAETAAALRTETEPDVELNLYTGVEYFQALSKDVAATRSGDRVSIMTMSFEPSEPLVDDLMQQLHAAADRRVDIDLCVDAFTFLIDDSEKNFGPLWLPLPIGQRNYQRRRAALEVLAEKPTARCSVINKPDAILSNPYADRSHLKVSVVNDKVYLGGPNMHKTERADMVVGFEDSQAAELLYDTMSAISHTGSTREVLGDQDFDIYMDSKTRILIDGGKVGQSIIMKEALKLIAEADEELVAAFQFFPSGRITERMKEAHERGVRVRPFHNHYSKYNIALGMRERMQKFMQRRSLPPELLGAELPKDMPVLHSKALASEKAAMVGSHNYVDLGVRYGTSEIALLREDPVFAAQVGSLLLSQTNAIELVTEPASLIPASKILPI